MIAIIKYNAGNIRSVENAVKRLGYDCIITDNVERISTAEKVIFPGVGEASSAMNYLKRDKLDTVIKSLKQPVLGICLGQQLMCKYSDEGSTVCLGIFNASVKKFPPEELVPHIGWNNLENIDGEILKGINTSDNVYFVHSYYSETCENTIAVCNYIVPFSAAMQKDNFYTTQFHPEKSAAVGEIVLKNFLEL